MQSTDYAPQVQPIKHPLSFIREGFVTLNPAQMNVILRECAYDKQRAIDETHVSVLAEIMRRGKWSPRDTLNFARIDGHLVLVNGYHRGHAQVSSGQNIEWTIVIQECESWDDVRALYTRFDTNIRKRSNQAVLDGFDFAERFGLSKSVSVALFAAAPIIANGLIASTRGIKGTAAFALRIMDDRLSVSVRYAPAAAEYGRMISPAPAAVKNKLTIGSITAVALVTIMHQPEKADEFWSGVAANDGLRRGDPRATLVQDMLTRNYRASGTQAAIGACVSAWNAHWEQRDMLLVRITPGRQIRLFGTPYTVTM